MGLCGKGIWLSHSYDLQRAMEMATSVDATHLMIKVGHGPLYFPEITHTLGPRVRNLGLHPIAWVQITDKAPQDALKAIAESLTIGYEGVVLYIGAALVTASQLRPLAEAIENASLPTNRLYLATPPFPHIPDRNILQLLAPLCKGGWMPLCFEKWGESTEQVIDRGVYQALGEFSLLWDGTPDIYPTLSPLRAGLGATFLPEEFIPWIEAVTHHGVDFFSIDNAADTEKALWPLIQSINVICMEQDLPEQTADPETKTGPNSAIPQPVYVTVGSSDTVWGIIIRHGLNKDIFWKWNGNLWDSRSLPRDPDYLQAGWRVRVK
ncbi:MAG: LysM peptidoglycan-binding domain-containing protein [Anaerolineae bacterium]|nr:LysM peptidoglycan-binding domain-containing protein [Anaerolineae bacterium]